MLQIREKVGYTKNRGKLVPQRLSEAVPTKFLCYKRNIWLALIETKDKSHGVGDGCSIALDYV